MTTAEALRTLTLTFDRVVRLGLASNYWPAAVLDDLVVVDLRLTNAFDPGKLAQLGVPQVIIEGAAKSTPPGYAFIPRT